MAEQKRAVVIGGGAAGMLAAGTAGSRGMEVLLIEKNDKLGKKILITGKGRCNLTNNCDVQELIENVPVNNAFLYSAFYTFSNQMLTDFFNQLGLETKVERGGRVFPKSDNAKDVVKTLEKYLRQNNVQIIRGEVSRIEKKNDRVTGVVLTDGKKISASRVIVATGGLSYPTTGSTGAGYQFARELGHTVTRLQPSLVPLEVKENWVKEAMGLSLRNIEISIYDQRDKKVYNDFGEMVFTHYGVSGPVILSASSHLKEPGRQKYKLVIDLKPALSEEKLDQRIQRDFNKYSNKFFANALDDLLPRKLIPVIIRLSKIPYDKQVNQITRIERRELVSLLKNLTLEISSFRPIKEAIVTSGGVTVDEVDPATMESKLIKGLFFAGEVLDVDAYTGGFNLQIAFSTGYLAGLNC